MKTKTKRMDIRQVLELPPPLHKYPRRPSALLRTVARLAAKADLRDVQFTYTTEGLEEAGPYLILMNHSCFLDLEMMTEIFRDMPYCIVCTSDGFVGKEWLMRRMGCIPTRKFVTDPELIGDIRYALHTLSTSVLMYPEASYSFDGCATPLPNRLGILLKQLDVPVVMVRTYGAFARDPLYNNLQKRAVRVRAEVRCIATREAVRTESVETLDAVLRKAFTFDNFAWQKENGVHIGEPFRADGLNRILYRCAHCGAEGQMEGRGVTLTCHACGAAWELDELGELHAVSGVGETRFAHIPDWYAWERETVRAELASGTYRLDVPCDIGIMVDFRAIYMVGEGRLVHDAGGFTLTGCDGALQYRQGPLASYGLYADYFWYEIGDVICIGDRRRLYYCFPKGTGDVVAKTRLAAEELFKLRLAHVRGARQKLPE